MPCNIAITKHKELFKELMNKTENCYAKTGEIQACENAVIPDTEDWTFHTHPEGTPEPSDIDLNTAKKLSKPIMCIGLTPSKETVCMDTRNMKRLCTFKC